MEKDPNKTHQKKMQRKKDVVDERIAKAQEERGVLILLRGNGKGKSSSAFGTMARSIGHGKRCAVIQFIKGRRETGEYLFFKDHPQVDFHVMGHGFTWEVQDRSRDIEAAQQAWTLAQEYLSNPEYDFLLFDEMSYMFKYQYLELPPVIDALIHRPKHQNVMITGRTMAVDLQEIADTVSQVDEIKHAFKAGVKAQAGIEF